MKEYPKQLVVRLAEKYKLAITIKPDGTITGLPNHLKLLRFLLDANKA